MPNQPLENSVDNLRRRLRFLPEAEREAEVAEFRSHLQERLTAYESLGETSEKALTSTLEKWGESQSLVRDLRYRWLRRKIDHPVLVAFFLLIAGQYLTYGASVILYRCYRLMDPAEYLGVIRLFPEFPGSLQLPPHQSWFPYTFCLIVINCLVASGLALLVARLHLKSQTKGSALYAALHLLLVLRFASLYLSQGSMSLFQGLNLQRFLVETAGSLYTLAGSLGAFLLLLLHLVYYPLITFLLIQSRKRALVTLKGLAA